MWFVTLNYFMLLTYFISKMSLYFLLSLYLLDLHTQVTRKFQTNCIPRSYGPITDPSKILTDCTYLLILPRHLKASPVTHFFTLICWDQPRGMTSTGIRAQRCIEYCFWPELFSPVQEVVKTRENYRFAKFQKEILCVYL